MNRYQHISELRHLYTFLAVADELSFRLAGERLGVAQPAVSRRIAELEHALGQTLFHREPSVRLTDVGQHLVDRLPLKLLSVESLLREVQEFNQPTVFRLAYSPSTFEQFVARWLDWRRKIPGSKTSLFEGTSDEVVQYVLLGEADAGLSLFAPDSELIESIEIGVDEIGVVVPVGHSLDRDRIELSDLDHVPLILFERQKNPLLHDTLTTQLSQGIDLVVAHEVSPRSVAVNLVLAGEGVAPLTCGLRHLCVSGTVWVPINAPPQIPTFLIARDLSKVQPEFTVLFAEQLAP